MLSLTSTGPPSELFPVPAHRIGVLKGDSMIRILKAVSVSFALLLSALAFGQGGSATGDLHVTVKDPKGNLVNNATVTVKDQAKGLERSGTGDVVGGYSVRLL